MDSQRLLDLIRIATYAQLEGTFTMSGNKNNYRFRFESQQIKDIKDLVERVMDKKIMGNPLTISISSKSLYEEIASLGFTHFYSYNWNIPKVNSFGPRGKAEYVRAVIDSIGNVDIDGASPQVQLSSVNSDSLQLFSKMFGGKTRGEYDGRTYLRWGGQEAIDLLESLDWRFNNRRNERGAELIKAVRWEDYLV